MSVTYSRSELTPNARVEYVDAHSGELLHVDYYRTIEARATSSGFVLPPDSFFEDPNNRDA